MTDADPHVIVPFDAVDPKTRLSPLLDRAEREALARTMLTDVLAALRELGVDHTVLATAPVDTPAPVAVDDRSLTTAVNARLAGDTVGEVEPPVPSPAGPVGVVMADLPLATPGALRRLLSGAADVTMAPGRAGGTNALCVCDPTFRVDYHGTSCRDHREAARRGGLELATVDSFRLATDVDEPADLVEVLLHARGTESAVWLREAGITVDTGDGRVTAVRDR